MKSNFFNKLFRIVLYIINHQLLIKKNKRLTRKHAHEANGGS